MLAPLSGFLCLVLASATPSPNELMALRSTLDGVLVDDKPIVVPGLPNFVKAYNASMIRFEGQLVMVFRIDVWENRHSFAAGLAMMALNDDFTAKGPVSVLETRQRFDIKSSSEDPILFVYHDQLHVAYNAVPDADLRQPRRMFIARIAGVPTSLPVRFVTTGVQELRVLDGRGKTPDVEKNWTPFVYDDVLHFVYTTNPPQVVKLPEDAKLWRRPAMPIIMQRLADEQLKPLSWRWGPMRGGTAAIREGGHYVSFFHGALFGDVGHGRKWMYFPGFYTFRAEPPFDIESWVPQPLLPADFFADNRWEKHVVFPRGMVDDGDLVHVSYGKDDREIRVMTLNKAKLYEKLQPVQTHRGAAADQQKSSFAPAATAWEPVAPQPIQPPLPFKVPSCAGQCHCRIYQR